jgi:lysyl endopeptidase
MRRLSLALSFLIAVSAAAAPGESNGPAFSRDSIGVKSYPAAPRLLEQAAGEPAVTLAAATEAAAEELEAIRAWNDADRLPLKNGFTRTIHEPISVRLEAAVAAKDGTIAHARGLAAASDRGTLIWSGSVRVEDADRIRLHLTDVVLPEGATLWVYGAGQAPIGFGKELAYEGSLYTPSVNGPVVHLEVEIPTPKNAQDVASFEIRDVLELVAPRALRTLQAQPEDASTCLIDATCTSTATFDAIAAARAAIAHLQYVKAGNGFVCSGGLVNDKVSATFVPYLLTANHCFDSQASATTLESYFDYKTSSCNGSAPGFPSAVLGSTLLATNASSDFTFVRLNSLPPGRTLLGWTTIEQPNGTKLHRVSHPFPDDLSLPAPQRYSSTNVNTTFGTCSSLPISNFLYSNGGTGGTYGGSSGAPVLISGGQLVGQLYGACGTDVSAGCNNVINAKVDGRFSTTFPSIQQFINVPDTVVQGCTPSATTACLNNDRFAVSVTWKTPSSQGTGTAIEYTSESALFWFFGSSNIEMILKVLNACGLNNSYWVFAAATTDVEYTITVTDTQKGSVRTYFHAQGTAAPAITDTSAFPASCP